MERIPSKRSEEAPAVDMVELRFGRHRNAEIRQLLNGK
jgi:hypothetical protein